MPSWKWRYSPERGAVIAIFFSFIGQCVKLWIELKQTWCIDVWQWNSGPIWKWGYSRRRWCDSGFSFSLIGKCMKLWIVFKQTLYMRFWLWMSRPSWNWGYSQEKSSVITIFFFNNWKVYNIMDRLKQTSYTYYGHQIQLKNEYFPKKGGGGIAAMVICGRFSQFFIVVLYFRCSCSKGCLAPR